MVILRIDHKDYRVFDSFSEITIKTAKEFHKICSNAPEEFLSLLKEQSKGGDSDKDQIKLKLSIRNENYFIKVKKSRI